MWQVPERFEIFSWLVLSGKFSFTVCLNSERISCWIAHGELNWKYTRNHSFVLSGILDTYLFFNFNKYWVPTILCWVLCIQRWKRQAWLSHQRDCCLVDGWTINRETHLWKLLGKIYKESLGLLQGILLGNLQGSMCENRKTTRK